MPDHQSSSWTYESDSDLIYSIKQVNNGFILKIADDCLVFKSVDEMAAWIKKDLHRSIDK